MPLLCFKVRCFWYCTCITWWWSWTTSLFCWRYSCREKEQETSHNWNKLSPPHITTGKMYSNLMYFHVNKSTGTIPLGLDLNLSGVLVNCANFWAIDSYFSACFSSKSSNFLLRWLDSLNGSGFVKPALTGPGAYNQKIHSKFPLLVLYSSQAFRSLSVTFMYINMFHTIWHVEG